MAYSGGWGTSLAAWSTPPQQTAATDDDEHAAVPFKTKNQGAELSEAELSSSNGVQPGHTGLLSSIKAYNAVTAAAPSNLASREAAVVKREADLERKERELVAREAELKRNAGGPRRNWPCPCLAIVHHDIAKVIPGPLQGMVRTAYFCYLGLVLCLIYNFVGSCAMVALNAPDRMSSWFLTVIYCLAGIPLAFILWYMKLYNAAASNGSLGYLGFFIGFAIHTAFCIWAAVAVPLAGERWSFTGFVAALRAFDVSKAAGVIYIIGACLWSVEATSSLWCLRMVYASFRSSGKQQQANGELSKMAVKAALNNRV